MPRESAAGLTVHAIAGTRSVQFGFDATKAARKGLLGFALGRREGNKIRWKNGYKFFPSLVPDPSPGQTHSTHEHPIQDFQWGDYSVDPGKSYRYVVQALYDDPASPRFSPEIELKVTTSNPETAKHGVYFNLGAIPSQAFAKRFGNKGPGPREQDDPDNDKVKWLSRGLLQAALDFIAQAKGAKFELRVAAYEFSYAPILEGLKAAAATGAKVRVSFHGGNRIGDDYVRPEAESCAAWDAIRSAKLLSAKNLELLPRTRYSAIPHNKFMVLLHDGHPIEVWTGSTNFTPSGFLGQCNVGHIVRDETIAGVYNTYWEELAKDPATRAFKRFTDALTKTLTAPLSKNQLSAMFSPREKGMMDWYAERLGATQASALFTAAFGVDDGLAEKFGADRDYLRFILMERKDRDPAVMGLLQQDRADTKIAIGSKLNSETIHQQLNGYRLDEWFRAEEHYRKQGNIFYIHTKFMLLDAMTDDPKLFTGSANFSNNSVSSNDENMLLMRGPDFAEPANIYAIEFMRMFRHLYFRTVAVQVAQAGKGGSKPVVYLDETDGWTQRFFKSGSYKDKLRRMFR